MLASSTRFKGSIRWWWGFGLLIGLPALLLALFGLRVARAERIEEEQRRHKQQIQLAQMADAGVAAVMAEIESELRRIDNEPTNQEPGGSFLDWHVLSYHRNGPLVFYRDKTYFVDSESDVNLKPVPTEWPPDTEDLIERAQAAEAQSARVAALQAYERVASVESRLSDWARLSLARVAQKYHDSEASDVLSDPNWSDSAGFTPMGLPVAIVASTYAEQLPLSKRSNFIPLIRRTLANLNHGTWWLTYDERRFYDGELRRLLHGSGSDPIPEDKSLLELSSLARIVQASTPSRRDAATRNIERNEKRRFLIVWLPASRDSNRWLGMAASENHLASLLDERLSPLLPVGLSTISIRDKEGDFIWGTLSDKSVATHTEALRSMDGWEVAFQNPAGVNWSERKQMLWYGFIGLLVVMLITGLAMTANVVHREEELARRQNEFVATVSHEFKSPITGVRLLMERLRHGRVVNSETTTEYYAAIDRELVRLERHVDRLLEAQKVQDGLKQYCFTVTALDELIAQAINEFRPLADARNLRLETRVEPKVPLVSIDKAAVANAIENLLDNAIKYSSTGTCVLISLYCSDGHVCVDISDEGIGITPAEQRHIFERFYRGSRGDSQNVRGSGLGLALVKAVAEGHGGSVEVSSALGKGSRFSLRLPLAKGRQNGGESSDN